MDYYTLVELIATIETIITPKRHFLDTYFTQEFLSDKEEIFFDDVFEGQVTLAPFVLPTAAGKPQARGDFGVKSFKPSYIKPLDIIKPTDAVKRMAGEPFSGELSNLDRYERAVTKALYRQKLQIEERWEWLAQHSLFFGKVTIAGDDYPARLIDFGRKAAMDLLIVDAAKKWSNIDHDIKADLEAWSAESAEETGYPTKDVYLCKELWPHFRKNDSIKEEMSLVVRNVSTINASPTASTPQTPVEFKGTVGDFNIYVHAGSYVDVDGVKKRYLQPGELAMIASVGETGQDGVYGVRGFGAIMDKKAGFQALPMFPKHWEEQNPSVDQVMTQSSPLMIPGRPNATRFVKGLL